MFFKNVKQHIPAIISGVCCWVLISVITGTSCWVRAVFGFPCPGCGSTRAAVALFRGNIKQAAAFHPLIFVSLALLIVFTAALIFKINILKLKRINILLWCVFALYMAVFIIRMILFYPDAEPMTYLDKSLWGRLINFITCNIYNTR